MPDVSIAEQQARQPMHEEMDAPAMPCEKDNVFLAFLEAMDQVPRDEHWDAFMKVMKERPMNRLPLDRDLFGNRD